ncbi:MAG: HAD family hydrolase [Fibrobacter sp.]|nr:HAD family hydrolase [Fibrobacter sp.]
MLPELDKVKGIIFDLDGTLYRMRWYMRPFLIIMLFPHIIRLPRFLKIRGRYAGVNLESSAALYQEVVKQLAPIEKKTEETLLHWIDKHFYRAFVDVMFFLRNSRPHLNKTLQMLKRHGIKLAVLSDYDRIPERLDKLKIDKSVFSTMTSSESFGALKPSPVPFKKIASDWNLDPSEVIVIGDREDTDGEGARRAGMHFIHIVENPVKSNKNSMLWKDAIKYLSF